MGDWALFIGWQQPSRGREREAIDVFNEALSYYAGLQEEGAIDSFEPVFLEPHGGDLGGFILVRGDREQIARIGTSDECIRRNTRATLVVDGFGVVGATAGARVG